HTLQRVQISQQILDLLVGHDLVETLHFCPAKLDDIDHALVIRGQSAQRKILMFENSLQAGAFLAMRRIGLMAAVAIVVVESSAGGLLRVEAEFGVGLAALDIATG